MAAHNRRLKVIEFTLGASSFEGQLTSWTIENNTEDGEKMHTFAPDGEFREDTEDDYALALKFFSDWRSGGVSDYLTANNGQTVAFVLDHHPDVAGEHVRWSGSVKLKAPNVGGDARTTETSEVTLQIIGKPVYTRVGA